MTFLNGGFSRKHGAQNRSILNIRDPPLQKSEELLQEPDLEHRIDVENTLQKILCRQILRLYSRICIYTSQGSVAELPWEVFFYSDNNPKTPQLTAYNELCTAAEGV
jgi:hypothetical protein